MHLLGLVANTLQCGACFILWFTVPPLNIFFCPLFWLFWLAHTPSSVNCGENYSMACISWGQGRLLPAWAESSINHQTGARPWSQRGQLLSLQRWEALFPFLTRYMQFAYPIICLLTRASQDNGRLWNMYTRPVKQQILRGSFCDSAL